MFIETKSLIQSPAYTTSPYSTGKPLLNEMYIPYSPGIYGRRSQSLKELMRWVKLTPEAIGIVKAITTDIVTKIKFRSIAKQKTGRPSKDIHKTNEEKAEEFVKSNHFKQVLYAAITDWLICGDAYLWKGQITEKEIKEWVKDVYKANNFEFKEIDFKATNYLDEEMNVSNVIHIPATTVDINHSATEIIEYKQEVPTTSEKPRIWKPEQIIHAKFMSLDGKVHGFSPLHSAIPVIKTLGLIKDYAGTYFENGGEPDWLILFESVGYGSNDRHIKMLKEQLQTYKKISNKHGFLVGEASGKVNLQKINDWNKDIEFHNLAIYYTGILAFAFNMPVARLQAIIGGVVKGGTGTSDLEDSAYQRSVQDAQEYWEDLLNTQLFNKYFNVDFIFEKSYLQDDIRETQRDDMKLSIIEKLEKLDLIKEEFKADAYSMILGTIPREFFNPNPDSQKTGLMNQGLLPNKKLMKGEATQSYSEQKKKEGEKKLNKPLGA